MFKKYAGLIATVALTLAPMAAFAGKVEVNSQKTSNNAAAVKQPQPPHNEQVKCYYRDEHGDWYYKKMEFSDCQDGIDFGWYEGYEYIEN